jgi:hypothetical protein
MEHLQRICVSEPISQPEDLERHLVHSDNHGSSILDPRISLKDIDEEYTINVVTVRQRKEERAGRRLNKGDIEEVLRSDGTLLRAQGRRQPRRSVNLRNCGSGSVIMKNESIMTDPVLGSDMELKREFRTTTRRTGRSKCWQEFKGTVLGTKVAP